MYLSQKKGKFQEDCRNWRAKVEDDKTWTELQAHFIEVQANLHKLQQTCLGKGKTVGYIWTISKRISCNKYFLRVSKIKLLEFDLVL